MSTSPRHEMKGNVVVGFVVFVVVMSVVLGLSLLWSHVNHGAESVSVALASWGLVVTGAIVSLVASALFMYTPSAPTANLFGMLPRMAVPLVGLIALGKVWPAWVALGGPSILIACYLVSLATEVLVVVRFLTVSNTGRLSNKPSVRSSSPNAMGV